MGVRYGETKPDVYVSGFAPAGDGHLKVRLRQWKRKPRVADIVILGDCDDDNLVAFAAIVAIDGEWPDGEAALTIDGGPYEIDDGWGRCDDPLDY